MTGFGTDEEEAAYQSYLASTDEDEIRNDRDEAILRNGWFAARDFFTRDTDKTEAAEATIPLSDLHLREQALAMAVQNSSGETPTSIVTKAEAFLSFLQKKPVPPTKES